MAVSLASLLLLFRVSPSSPQQHSPVAAVGYAFCGGHVTLAGANCLRRRTRVTTRSGASSSSSSSSSGRSVADSSRSASSTPLPFGARSSTSGACRKGDGLLVAAASRWEDDEEDDEDLGVGGGRKRAVRKPLRAPWEDIQWTNPSKRTAQDGRRAGWVEKEDEEIEEDDDDVLGLGERRRARVQPRGYPQRDLEDEDDIDDDRPRRRRPRPDAGDAQPRPSGWDTAEWFGGAQDANQGGLFNWARSFYNTLFWYGGALSEDDDELPAMNFQDLLERYDLPAGEQPPLRARPIVPPEDLATEQDFRWRPSGRDSAASASAAEATRRRRRKSRDVAVNGDVAEDSRRRPRREEGRSFERGQEGFGRRGEGGAARAKGEGGRASGDVVAIGQLRRKQRQLEDRESKCDAGLQKVRERLDVVDATVELWMRRSAGMLSRGGSETDTDVLQAKRRIYGLKGEGQQLDSAMVELEGRLEDCRAKLDRILQELDLLGADWMPQAFYTPDEARDMDRATEMPPQTADAGSQAVEVGKKESSGLDAKLVEMDSLGLRPEKERDVEAEAVSAAKDLDV